MSKKIIYAEDAIEAVHSLYAIFGSEGEWVDRKDVFEAINGLPSAQTEPCEEAQHILDYLDNILHPLISPEHWNVYSELYDMIAVLPTAQPEKRTEECTEMHACDLISRRVAIDGFYEMASDMDHLCTVNDYVSFLESLPSAQSKPAISLSWIEGQIEWLKSLDNAFSTLIAEQILAMMNKWKDEQNGRFN